MSFRSSTSSSRRSLALGSLLIAGLWALIDASTLPRTAYHGGETLARKWRKLEALERTGPVDVFVIGASHVDRGFDAASFGEASGKRAFNLGVAGTDLYFQSLLVRALLQSGRRPEAIIWCFLDTVQWNTSINLQYLAAPAMAGARGERRALGALEPHLPQFQRLRLRDWYAELAGAAANSVDDHGLLQDSPKAAPGDGSDHEDPRDAPRMSVGRDYGLDAGAVRAHVRETIALATDAGTRVWLVFTPYRESVFARESPRIRLLLAGGQDGFFDWRRELARELGLSILDLRLWPEISDDARLFGDETHLNNEGARRLGQLCAEFYSGRRPLPEPGRGGPPALELERAFGHAPPEVPQLLLHARHPLAALQPSAGDAHGSDFYASFEIAERGRYRLELDAPDGRARGGVCALRVGPGWFRVLKTGAAASTEWQLDAGRHVFELHGLGPDALPWSELALVRAKRESPRPSGSGDQD